MCFHPGRSSVLWRASCLPVVWLLALAVNVARLSAQPAGIELPAWVREVGARTAPEGERAFRIEPPPRDGGPEQPFTTAIQIAIDACSATGGGTVSFAPGVYPTGALFLKSNVHLRIDQGVTLLGVQDEAAYPKIWTRVAGIEMEWPAALINVNEQENVKISGGGTIDGNGELWWKKYWTMRRDYEPRGLRWAVDYDCERVRLVVVWKSRDVTLEGVHLRRAGFWTVQLAYSDHVTVAGVTIRDNGGPSTDGVDIDSSSHVLVERCDIDNNDDCICLKAGRDADGLRVNRPAEYVLVRDNLTRSGGGILSFGSETSGGIRHVVAYGNRGIGTKEGLRFKSAKTRGGYIEDVRIYDTTMENVPLPFTFTLNWNPSYSYATLPAGRTDVPAHWKVMNEPVLPPERGLAEFKEITIAGVNVTGARRIFTAAGLPEKPLLDVRWRNIRASGAEAGAIEHARNWTMDDVLLTTDDGQPVRIVDGAQVAAPAVTSRGGR